MSPARMKRDLDALLSTFRSQNLPYGCFKPSADAAPRCCVAIGDQCVDLTVIQALLPAETVGCWEQVTSLDANLAGNAPSNTAHAAGCGPIVARRVPSSRIMT